MTHEYFPDFNNPSLYDLAYEKKAATILELYSQTERKLQKLAYTLSELQQGPIISYTDAVTLIQRGNQLQQLSMMIIEVSENDDSSARIALDDTRTRLIEPPELLLPERESPMTLAEMEEADQLGIQRGTADFLSILVPEKITDKNMRQIYFSSWRRDLLERPFGTLPVDEYGNSSFSLSTILSNIDIEYFYPSDSKFPYRTIYVNDEAKLF